MTTKLTKEQEQALFWRIRKETDPALKDDLRKEAVTAFLWLVPVNASRFGRYHREDLEQEGYMALYRAVDGFDPGRGLRFSTYAVHWIRQAFFQHLYNNCSTVRIPVYLHKVMSKVRQGKDVSDLSAKVLETARAVNDRHMVPIDSVMDPLAPEAPERDTTELTKLLGVAMKGLRERERYLIEQRYFSGRTYRDIGDEIGVSVERVRQIIQKGLARCQTSELEGML